MKFFFPLFGKLIYLLKASLKKVDKGWNNELIYPKSLCPAIAETYSMILEVHKLNKSLDPL